ncbi:hypothetical protein [Corallococcus sp. 4LFB]|uniref:hypothetical protein n=1 Tax=Corallococcus sp. 4LFB TaxID=3383249 RepID=UPI003976A3E8
MRVCDRPCTSTHAALFREGTYQPRSSTPSSVRSVTSRAEPKSAGSTAAGFG